MRLFKQIFLTLFFCAVSGLIFSAKDPGYFTVNDRVFSFYQNDTASPSKNGFDLNLIEGGVVFNAMLIKKDDRNKYELGSGSGFAVFIKSDLSRFMLGIHNIVQDFKDKDVNKLNFNITARGISILYRYEFDRVFGLFPGISLGISGSTTQLSCADNACKFNYPDVNIKEVTAPAAVGMLNVPLAFIDIFVGYYYFSDTKLKIGDRDNQKEYEVNLGNDVYIFGLGLRF